jgi:hypothetical protein
VLCVSTAAGKEIATCTDRLAAKLGLRRCPPVRMVAATIPPLVWSLGLRPVIVLPSTLLAELSPAQRDALIAHELAHVRRRDDLVRWLEVIALVAFWWNPVAWFARRRLREAEEECCDAWVVWALPAERRGYGEAMLATIEFLSGGPKLPALAGSTFGGSFCKRRIEMIMKRNVNRKLSWAALGMIVVLAASVLPIVAQTTGLDAAEGLAQPDSAATKKSDAVADDRPAANAGIGSDDVQVGKAANAAGSATSVPTPEPSSDAVEPASNAGRDPAPNADADSGRSGSRAPSVEEILNRISRLEQLLQERSDQRSAAGTSLRSRSSSPSDLVLSSDKREQDLQEELLMLDVLAAKAEIEPARLAWERSTVANKKQPGTVSDLAVEQQRAELHTKEIQARRAEAILALYKRQVERKREETALQQKQQKRAEAALQQQERQRATAGAVRNRESAADVAHKALRGEELAQLKKLNEQIGKEITRLELLLKEEPNSPETWMEVESFWRAYRSLQRREANKEDIGGGSATNGKN